MNVRIELSEKDVKDLLIDYLKSQLGESILLTENNIKIEVKSKQNYKSEWEVANFRAVYKSSKHGMR